MKWILKNTDSTDAKKRMVLCKEKQNNHKTRKIPLPLVKLIKIKIEKIKIDKTKTRKGDVENWLQKTRGSWRTVFIPKPEKPRLLLSSYQTGKFNSICSDARKQSLLYISDRNIKDIRTFENLLIFSYVIGNVYPIWSYNPVSKY